MESAEHTHDVIITFNGEDRRFGYRSDELVGTLLGKAKSEFHAEGNNRLGLFTQAGVELPDGESLKQAGVTEGEILVLRQSSTRGGA